MLQAEAKHNLNLRECYVIGDTGSDMVAASEADAKKILVKTGWGESSLTTHRVEWKGIEPEYIADDLAEAVRWIADTESAK